MPKIPGPFPSRTWESGSPAQIDHPVPGSTKVPIRSKDPSRKSCANPESGADKSPSNPKVANVDKADFRKKVLKSNSFLQIQNQDRQVGRKIQRLSDQMWETNVGVWGRMRLNIRLEFVQDPSGFQPFHRVRGTNLNAANRLCIRQHTRRIGYSCAQNCKLDIGQRSQKHSKRARSGIPSKVCHRAPTYNEDI